MQTSSQTALLPEGCYHSVVEGQDCLVIGSGVWVFWGAEGQALNLKGFGPRRLHPTLPLEPNMLVAVQQRGILPAPLTVVHGVTGHYTQAITYDSSLEGTGPGHGRKQRRPRVVSK